MNCIIPPRLHKGDTIGFVSPSAGPSPLAIHRIERAQATLERLGYRVKVGKHSLQSAGDVSGTVVERVADLHDMFRDPEVNMIMCTIGGNNSNQLLKHLDYALIQQNPKIFIGYSDITVLHYAFFSQSKLSTYYGPCAMTQFGEYPNVLPYTLEYFSREVSGENSTSYPVLASQDWTDEFLNWFEKKDLSRARTLVPNSGYEWLKEGSAEGTALGGAILSINHLAGTKYWCDPQGSIFFLDLLKDNSLLNENAVTSLLTDLDNLGLFDAIAGLIVSRPAGYSDGEKTRLKETILEYAGDKDYPIVIDANIGHTDPIATIRYGRSIRLDSSTNMISFC